MTYTLSNRIVVGVDESDAAVAAVRWAVREARLRHATVHLVCSYHSDASLRAPYASWSWVTRQDERYAAAQAELAATAELASRHLPPGRLITELASEPPVRALLDRAVGAEMLVLGTTRPHRQPGQPPLAMGPVGRACLCLAHCPVVVVSPDDQSPERSPGQHQRHLSSRQRTPQTAEPSPASADAVTSRPARAPSARRG